MENDKIALVTVCVPTYNSGRFLKKTLNSIINQNYPNFEVIVSDNASTDDTERIAKSFGSKVQFRRNPTNIGTCGNCNECLKVTKSEFVAFYHSDDIYEPNIVSKEVGFLQTHPKVGAVFSLNVLINKNGRVVGKTRLPRELKARNIYNFNEIYNALLKNGNSFLPTPTFMARRTVYDDVGLFNEKDFGASADLEMWLRILEEYSIGILNEKLMKYRIGSLSSLLDWNKRTKRADFFSVMDYFAKSPALTVKIEKRFWKKYEYYKKLDNVLLVKNLLKKGEINKARNLLNKTLSVNFIINSFEKLNGLKQLIVAIILVFGINIGFGKYFGNILKRI
jgi:glycosyltransferase involved in cell wall biosynthesis